MPLALAVASFYTRRKEVSPGGVASEAEWADLVAQMGSPTCPPTGRYNCPDGGRYSTQKVAAITAWMEPAKKRYNFAIILLKNEHFSGLGISVRFARYFLTGKCEIPSGQACLGRSAWQL